MADCNCGFELMRALRTLSAISSGLMEEYFEVRKNNTLSFIEDQMSLRQSELNQLEVEIAEKYGDDKVKMEFYLGECPTGLTDKVINRLKSATDEREVSNVLEGIIAILVNQANSALKLCQVVEQNG